MRNSLQSGTLELVDGFMTALRAWVPAGVECRLDVPEHGSADHAFADVLLPARIGGTPLTFAIVAERTGERPTAAAAERAGELEEVPLVVGRYLSPTVRARLERSGWSYWDTTGNALVSASKPVLAVRMEGARRDPAPSHVGAARELKSLGGASAARVVVQLLLDPHANTTRELAKRAQVGLGTASRVVSLLRHENLLDPTGSGPIRVPDRMDLVTRWTRDYDFITANRAKRYRSPLGRDGVVAALQRDLESDSYAYTGLEAARRRLSVDPSQQPLSAPVTDLWLYARDRLAVERSGRLLADPAGDVTVAQGPFLERGAVSEGSDTNPSIQSAWPWRVAGDLMSQSGRHAQVGHDFAEYLDRHARS